ncbi:transglycosylase domain-containing protein [Rudaeicoccus suwonensis]|uniref:Membrane peptidoglycan carboxypeptidase n=1 Tax=Rudaeicoccus suwonensis TaxID=657409 RepID=A0A561E3X0_9MICO|nr:transglycosylase domain-containing protein [Rudaeicoccus suwonensis]TWE10313.1 membrane peptidoglycan carboxypeptidase [Rudaeicoccus suwonensis]
MTDQTRAARRRKPAGGSTSRGGSGRSGNGGSGVRTRRFFGRGKPKKEHGLIFKVVVRTILGLFTLCVLGFLALVVMYLRTTIPQPQADAGKQVSIIYYSDGKTELGRFSTVNRQDVQLSQVPKTVQYEFLAAEDRNFYKNSGVSITGTLRATFVTLSGGGEQGGSTITQQYVKNYFLTQDRSVSRKLKEIMIALKIDRKYSKTEILQDYLNNIYFGRGAYGIQAASQAYFGVNVEQLNDSQGAFLASVINAPAIYDPQYGEANAERANARMVYVLDGMVKEGWMTQAVRNQQQFPTFKTYQPVQQNTGTNGYIVNAVRNELQNKLGLSQPDIDRGGLRITTTISKPDQDAAVAAVNNNVSSEQVWLDEIRTGLIAEKPDGAVVAMYGGSDPAATQDSATISTMQGGSSFKIFGLAAALQDGFTLNQTYNGASPLVIGKQKFTNDNNEQFGNITLTKALAYSVNTVFLQLNQNLGSGKTLAAAEQLGIPSTDPGMNDPQVNDILGIAAVRVIDMANAYNTVSTGGKKATPYFIQSVSSVEGDYSYTAHPQTQQVISSGVANNIADAASHVLTDPGATAQQTAGQLGRPAAGKTGTTNNYLSAWFTGFTPDQLTTSVGMYAGNGTTPLAQAGQSFYGGDVPATIWLDFMRAALKGQPVAQLPNSTTVSPATTFSSPASTAPPSTTASSPSPTQSQPSVTTSAPPNPGPSKTVPTPSRTIPTPSRTAPTPSHTEAPGGSVEGADSDGGGLSQPLVGAG